MGQNWAVDANDKPVPETMPDGVGTKMLGFPLGRSSESVTRSNNAWVSGRQPIAGTNGNWVDTSGRTADTTFKTFTKISNLDELSGIRFERFHGLQSAGRQPRQGQRGVAPRLPRASVLGLRSFLCRASPTRLPGQRVRWAPGRRRHTSRGTGRPSRQNRCCRCTATGRRRVMRAPRVLADGPVLLTQTINEHADERGTRHAMVWLCDRKAARKNRSKIKETFERRPLILGRRQPPPPLATNSGNPLSAIGAHPCRMRLPQSARKSYLPSLAASC